MDSSYNLFSLYEWGRIHPHSYAWAKFFAIVNECHSFCFSIHPFKPAENSSHSFKLSVILLISDAKDFHNEVVHHAQEAFCSSNKNNNKKKVLCFAVYVSSNKWVVFWSKEIPSVISREGPVTYAAISDDPVRAAWLCSNEKQFEWADKQLINSFSFFFLFSSSLCLSQHLSLSLNLFLS